MSIGLGNHVNLPLENTKMEIESEIENTLNFLVLLFVWGWSCCHPQPTPPQKKKKKYEKERMTNNIPGLRVFKSKLSPMRNAIYFFPAMLFKVDLWRGKFPGYDKSNNNHHPHPSPRIFKRKWSPMQKTEP